MNDNALKQAIEKLENMDEDKRSDVILYMSNEAANECWENGKQLANQLIKYKDDEEKLSVINETLISICGWSLESLIDQVERGIDHESLESLPGFDDYLR